MTCTQFVHFSEYDHVYFSWSWEWLHFYAIKWIFAPISSMLGLSLKQGLERLVNCTGGCNLKHKFVKHSFQCFNLSVWLIILSWNLLRIERARLKGSWSIFSRASFQLRSCTSIYLSRPGQYAHSYNILSTSSSGWIESYQCFICSVILQKESLFVVLRKLGSLPLFMHTGGAYDNIYPFFCEFSWQTWC